MESKEMYEVPYMRSLSYCMNKFVEKGYKENFEVDEAGLYSQETKKRYQPEDVTIVNYYRFEGVSNPDDNSILYVLETTDGAKGMLVDAYGAYANPETSKFIKSVELIKRD